MSDGADSHPRVSRDPAHESAQAGQTQADESLAQSQRQIRQFADAMPFIVWTAEPDGSVDFSNRQFFDYTGVSPATPAATLWQACVHPDDLARCLALWSACVREESPFEVELRVRRGADGEHRWFRVQALPTRDTSGRLAKWYGTGIDIHAIKELEREATQHAARLTATLESLTDAFMTLDPQWRMSYVNAEGERLLQRARGELLGRSLWELFPEAVGSTFDLEYRRAIAERATVSFEEYYEPLETWFDVRAYPSADGLAVYFRDVTERRDSREALRVSEERFRLLSKATNDAIWDWNLLTDALWWNEGFEVLFGFSRAEVEPGIESWTNRIHPEDRERIVAGIHGVIDRGADSWSSEYRFRRKDESYAYVLDRGHIIRDPSGQAVRMIGGMTDLTTRHAIEEQLFRSQRLESIGTLAGGIAHDLNNVLTPIMGSVALLKHRETVPKKLEVLSTLEACAQHGADMVRQLLTFARGTPEGARSIVNLVTLATDVLKFVRDTFPKDVTSVLQVSRQVWPVRADPTQVRQLLTNLCVNARDAMPHGGMLTIAVEGLVIDEVYAGTYMEAKPGPYMLVRVEDTGVGMTREVQDRIFEPFFTTKAVGKGTGLGLSTCHAIVRSHGGFIDVYSEVGAGTRFRIYLPADVPPGAAGETATEEDFLPRGKGEVVLVVDDEAGVREVTSSILEQFGYRTLTAPHGAEAAQIFAQRAGEVALVLTDMSMPVMDGPATVVALKGIDAHVKIVGMSGLDGDGKVAKARAAGLSEFVAKPFNAETLLTTVRRVLG